MGQKQTSEVKEFLSKVAATIVASSIIATAGVLWKMNERLSKIEAVLSTMHQSNLAGQTHDVATNPPKVPRNF